MNSAGATVLEPLETDRCDEFDTNDLVEGDFGIIATLWVSLSSFCFFEGEPPLLKVKVRLRGRSRLELPGLLSLDDASSSSADPCRDFDDRDGAGFAEGAPMADSAEDLRDACGVSSLCVLTKSALTSSFKVLI